VTRFYECGLVDEDRTRGRTGTLSRS